MPVTASARSLPLLMWRMVEEKPLNMTCTCPPSMSVTAWPLPLYGTCVILIPARLLSSSPVRCPTLATPVEAKLTAPGFAFASAINSCRLFACTEGCAVSTLGEVAICVMVA